MAQAHSHSGQGTEGPMSQVGNIIAVSSGKGGVGKSTASVNLAIEFSKLGNRVGLLDADIYGPNIPTMLGVTETPKIVEDRQGKEFFLPPTGKGGIKTMSMGFLVKGDQPAIWRGPMLHNILQQFANQIDWGELDFLFIDMPPGTGDVQLSLAQLLKLRGAVVVTTPQEVALQDVRKAVHMWEKVKVPVLGVIENMAYFECDGCNKKHEIFGSGGGGDLAKQFNSELLGQVPLNPKLRQAGDQGRPIDQIEFQGIAKRLLERADQSKKEVDPATIVQIGKF